MNCRFHRTFCSVGLLYFVGLLSAGASTVQKQVAKTPLATKSQTLPVKKTKGLIAAEDKLLTVDAKEQMAKLACDRLKAAWTDATLKYNLASAQLDSAKAKTKAANENAYSAAKEKFDQAMSDGKAEAAALKVRWDKLAPKLHYTQIEAASKDMQASYALLRMKSESAQELYEDVRWSNRPHTEEQRIASKEEAIAQEESNNLLLQLLAAKSRLLAGDVKLVTVTVEKTIALDELREKKDSMTSKVAKESAAAISSLGDLVRKSASQVCSISASVDQLVTTAKQLTVLDKDLAKQTNRPVKHSSIKLVIASGPSKAQVAAALLDLSNNLNESIVTIDRRCIVLAPIKEGDADRSQAIVQRATAISRLVEAKTEMEVANGALSTSMSRWNSFEIE